MEQARGIRPPVGEGRGGRQVWARGVTGGGGQNQRTDTGLKASHDLSCPKSRARAVQRGTEHSSGPPVSPWAL